MTDFMATKLTADDDPNGKIYSVRRPSKSLYPSDAGGGMLVQLLKSINDNDASNQPYERGTKSHPFDFRVAMLFRVHNVHHGTCVEAKKQAIVGLGHKSEAVEKALTPLCDFSWQSTIAQVCEDWIQVGNGYLEVVRGGTSGDKITGLHFLPANDVKIVIENDLYQRHYSIRGGTVAAHPSTSGGVMAAFGDLKDFRARHKIAPERKISEVIHFPEASSLNRWYGYPSWLAAVASVELTQALHQHQMDFHSNRGVPEFLLFLLGSKVDTKTWGSLTSAFNSFVGVGNSHKASVFNLTDPLLKVQVEKLAVEGIVNGTFFRDMSETLSVNIVSAHRVPPSLAGILIPGKMGAANETSNAIISFQALVVGPAQHTFETLLGTTLGNATTNGGLSLTPTSFPFKTIVEEMAESMASLAPVDTMGRMKSELPQAASEGRNINAGLKKEDAPAFLAEVLAKMLER